MKKLFYLALMIVTVLAEDSFAGTTGKIAGTVKDAQTGEPLIGVNVLIEGTTMGNSTDLEGYYVILNVPPGKYSLVASAIGYNRKKVTDVVVSVDLTTKVDFALTQTAVEIQEVVVTAERTGVKKDLTSSEARVNADQIQNMPVQEVHEVLTLQSGVTVDKGGAIHIRGGRTSEVAYWVDGVSISDVYDGGQAVQVDNNSVQELQVISGTFNAEYGEAMSGIVNIVTKDGGQDYHGSITTYIGDYVTSGGGSYGGREVYFDGRSAPPIFSDFTFYNLNKVRPTDTRNVEFSLSGPVPEIPALTFYASGRYYYSDGWLYGNHVVYTDGSLDTNTIKVIPDLNRPGAATLVINDNPVPMNNRKRFSGQVKLSYQFSPQMKLNLSALGSRIDFRDYNHDWIYNPDGDVNKFDRGYDVSAQWTHALNPTSFYTVNASFFFKGFKEYLYEDPFDKRYFPNPFYDPTIRIESQREFRKIGTNLHHFQRRTETRVLKADYTNQINKLHQLKTGIETKLHRLYFKDFDIIPVNVPGQGWVGSIPADTTPAFQEYTATPFQFSAYIQDKLEYENMIVNVGVRFDYFNSKGEILADPSDPNVYIPRKSENRNLPLRERLAKWYKKASPKSSISPRFGISYPITDQGILHFSYGHFLQIPSFIHLYQKPGYKVTEASSLQGVFGNPDLNPQKTVMYEFGLQQQLTDEINFDLTGFYRDTRDWVSTSTRIPVGDDPEGAATFYTIFINRDYANSRGITFTMDKRHSDWWSLNFSYTFQIAEGNNSNPDEEQGAQQDNKEPTRVLTPLDWDQRHTANMTFGFGPTHDWGVFVIGRYGSGLPYTPAINQAEAQGQDVARVLPKNSRRRPATYNIDLRLFKNMRIAPFNAQFFVKVFNLLDTRNEIDVYGETGRATATMQALGIPDDVNNNPSRINRVEQYLLRPDFYSEPREVQLGVELSF